MSSAPFLKTQPLADAMYLVHGTKEAQEGRGGMSKVSLILFCLAFAVCCLSPHQDSAARQRQSTASSKPVSPIQVGTIATSALKAGCGGLTVSCGRLSSGPLSYAKGWSDNGLTSQSSLSVASSGSSSQAAGLGPGLLTSPSVLAGLGAELCEPAMS